MPAPSRTRDLAWLLLLSMAAAGAMLSFRDRHRGAPVETVPRTLASMDSLAREPAPRAGAPRRSTPGTQEIQDAVRRAFEGAVNADARRSVCGDFNGDGSPDLAVVARPAKGALARVNHELANWTLQDALAAAPGRARPTRFALAQGDVVLAVIHGYGAAGWRDPQARQSYLVRNAVGERLATRAMQVAARGLAGSEAARIRGDVIAESIGGRPGFLYWSGVRYLWFLLPPAAAGP